MTEKEDHKKVSIHPTLSVYLSENALPNENDSTNCCAYIKKLNKNKLQASSLMGGCLQLLVSGLHIAWGIWRLDFAESWFEKINGVFIFLVLSFYVAAMIGGFIAGFIVRIWRKQAIYCLSGSIMVISSLISIIWSDKILILFARMLAGLAHGLVYNVIVIHAGENAMKQIRGVVTSSINCILWLSIFIGSLLIATVQMGISTSISSDRMIGIFGLGFSVFALMYTMFWTQESVVYLLIHGKLGEALELLANLRNEKTETGSVSDDFEEMRLMVNQEKQESKNIFKDKNTKPLALIIALKFLHVLTNNIVFNWIMMIITARLLPRTNRRMTPIILTAPRFFGSVLQTLLADSFGRKTFLNISCALSGVTLLILEIMILSGANLYLHVRFLLISENFIESSRRRDMSPTDWVVTTLCIVFQFFVSLGIDPMHHVVTSEAFATSKKSWSVVLVTTLENVAQLLFIVICFIDGVIVTIETTFHLVLFISALCIWLLIVISVLYLPETRYVSLSKTRDLFRNIKSRCCQ